MTGPIPHGDIYAALVLALVGTALVLGRHGHARIVALFRADENNRRLARRDMLTGLMNRFALTQAFADAIADAGGQPDAAIAIYLVDLDRFKAINDTFGHAMGDAVIVETGERLRQAAEGYAEVARMGGDEFMLIARGERLDGERIVGFAETILERLGAPFEIEGNLVMLAGSVGVAIYPQHGRDMAELMTHADCALYEAKREGRGRFRLFDESLRSRLAQERLLEKELDEALREDGIEVWYQPIKSLRTGGVSGYEALARWRHPTPRSGAARPFRAHRRAERRHPPARRDRARKGLPGGGDLGRTGVDQRQPEPAAVPPAGAAGARRSSARSRSRGWRRRGSFWRSRNRCCWRIRR